MVLRKLKKMTRPEGVSSITEIYPWFVWRFCYSCEHEFRRETGLLIRAHRWMNGISIHGNAIRTAEEYVWSSHGYDGLRTYYLCEKCADKHEGAEEAFLALEGVEMYCTSSNVPAEA